MANAVFFSNNAQQTTLSGSISASATTITVGATTGFPGNTPYVLAVDFGAATEELVFVTGVAGLNLTVTRGYGGTSAQSHSLGAVVRHVYDATEATAFRTHEAATAAVHGVAGTLVGTSDTQTLANKTLTAPTINAGALTGTFTGSPTFPGTVTLSGTLTSSGGTLSGTWAGAPIFSGVHNHTAAVQSTLSASTGVATGALVAGDTFDRFRTTAAGSMEWGPGNLARDTFVFRDGAGQLGTTDTMWRVYRAASSSASFSTLVAGDPNSRWYTQADGKMNWGPGSATQDTVLYRSGVGALTTDGAFNVGGNLTVSGVGQVLAAYKTADTARTSATVTDDPHLAVSVAANAVYLVTAYLMVDTSDASTADLNLDWTVPASADGKWVGLGQPVGATSTDGTMRTVSTIIDQARTFGATVDSANPLSIVVHATLKTVSAGTYACSWARTGGSGTLTMLQYSSLILRRVA
ncbi:hypothetical protein ABZY09_30560 [Streptomyces sp. NPDC002928]|uniref:hypothetical protein n=1 Tax=Streptomyces sp. NPDC002928 TaxID=3154440 RepID=UPI0033BD8973